MQRLNTLAVLIMMALLAACGDDGDGGAKGAISETDSVEGAAASLDESPSVDKLPPVKTETPADQFVEINDASDCLGVFWGLANETQRQRALEEYVAIIDGRALSKKSDGFAKKDFIVSKANEVNELVAPFAGKTLITHTTEPGEDSYRQYNFEQKAFFDSSKFTWSEGIRFYENSGGPSGSCALRAINGNAWGSRFTVEDEAQARAAEAARVNGNSSVKFYMHVESAGAMDDGLTTPLIDARLLRIEIVDEAGQLIARAHPIMSLEEADRKRAEEEAICAQRPGGCEW